MGEAFTASYIVDVRPDWPSSDETVVSADSAELLGSHTKEYFHCRFYPQNQQSWIGQFELTLGISHFGGVFSTPSPDEALVVAGSSGYWVKVLKREILRMELPPITSVLPNPDNGVILVSTWRDIIAYKSSSICWIQRNVMDDGMKIMGADSTHIKLQGYRDGQVVIAELDLFSKNLSKCEREAR